MMQVVVLSLGRATRAWDEQHLDVSAGAGQIGGAGTGGFTDAVSGAAARFAATWQRHTTALAGRAEAQADGLRAVLTDYAGTDGRTAGEVLAILFQVGEQR